jgi:hypothetical protein
LVRSITASDWDDTTRRLVQPLLRRALEMRRQIAREGWWNLDGGAGTTFWWFVP